MKSAKQAVADMEKLHLLAEEVKELAVGMLFLCFFWEKNDKEK